MVSREFADARENRPDARSAMNRHNNEAGRTVRTFIIFTFLISFTDFLPATLETCSEHPEGTEAIITPKSGLVYIMK